MLSAAKTCCALALVVAVSPEKRRRSIGIHSWIQRGTAKPASGEQAENNRRRDFLSGAARSYRAPRQRHCNLSCPSRVSAVVSAQSSRWLRCARKSIRQRESPERAVNKGAKNEHRATSKAHQELS